MDDVPPSKILLYFQCQAEDYLWLDVNLLKRYFVVVSINDIVSVKITLPSFYCFSCLRSFFILTLIGIGITHMSFMKN